MRRRFRIEFLIGLTIACLIGSGVLADQAAIVIDSDLADWNDMSAGYADPAGDAGLNEIDSVGSGVETDSNENNDFRLYLDTESAVSESIARCGYVAILISQILGHLQMRWHGDGAQHASREHLQELATRQK